MMLADHGAEVIKIESAGGDTSRNNGPFRDDDPDHDWAGYFVSLNRNKKSVQLDLKSSAGKAAFRKLAATADVVVENFRPGVMDRLGLSYETLAADNPALVYAAIRGFGDPRTGNSPYADWPSYDVVAQAMGGLMATTGPDADHPTKVGPGIGDVFAGMMMSFGVMAALREANATGKGQFLDVAMYDAMISLCERAVYQHDMTGDVPTPEGNGHPLLAPFGLFPCCDGSVALGIVDDAFWQILAQAMAKPELARDPRYATRAARSENAADVNAMVGDWTARHSKAQLTDILGGNVPFGPLNTIKDIFADPHVAARQMLAQVPHPDAGHDPWTVAANPLRFGAHSPAEFTAPPKLGEHTDAILAAAGPLVSSDDEKRSLRDAFGAFATGVTVVTTRQGDGTPRGFTANSFSSVSLDPPLLLICIAKTAHSLDSFSQSEHFAINVLSDQQKAVSGLFASRAPDKFDQTSWHAAYAQMPVLDGSLASFVCERHKLVDAGDHLILIGLVKEHETSDSQPLGYFRGSYFSIGLEDPLVKAASSSGKVSIGAVMTCDQEILLQKLPDGKLCVPNMAPDQSSLEALINTLKSAGNTPIVDHLYAIYSDSATDCHCIYYHGTISGQAPDNMQYFPISDLPMDRLNNAAERSMLARYRDEHKHGRFGIYQGDEASGLVHQIAGMHRSTH
jgi:crotonobetainyl-CoA:carnitine CoA-transferase CaiB-like acyl-CoA transferase